MAKKHETYFHVDGKSLSLKRHYVIYEYDMEKSEYP